LRHAKALKTKYQMVGCKEKSSTFEMEASVSIIDGAADSPMPNHVTLKQCFRRHKVERYQQAFQLQED
jgi:hypothetical protein